MRVMFLNFHEFSTYGPSRRDSKWFLKVVLDLSPKGKQKDLTCFGMTGDLRVKKCEDKFARLEIVEKLLRTCPERSNTIGTTLPKNNSMFQVHDKL